jgi:hypothetical protein
VDVLVLDGQEAARCVEHLVFSIRMVLRQDVGLCLFDPPHGAPFVEGAFRFDDGGGITAENPDVAVWGLLRC